MTFKLSIRSFIRASVCIVSFLFLAGLIIKGYSVVSGRDRLFGLVHLFDLNAEQTVTVWYQTMMLTLIGILSLIIAKDHRERKAPFAGHWLGLGVIFILMGMDEFVSLHELIGDEILAPVLHTAGHFNSTWLIFAIPLVFLFMFSYLKFFLALPAMDRNRMILALFIYVCGAALIEIPENLYSAHHGEGNLVFVTFVAIEEFLEMVGMLLLNIALLKKIAGSVKSATIEVVDDRG